MYYVQVDQIGKPTAFYNTMINVDIPDDAKPITEEQWQILAAGHGLKGFVNGLIKDLPQEIITPMQILSMMSSVSRPQMLQALEDFEIITEQEAYGWLSGILPATVERILNQLPTSARGIARKRALMPTAVDPTDQLVAALAAEKGMEAEALIHLFKHASEL